VWSREGPYADFPISTLILHINREMIHHGAEIAASETFTSTAPRRRRSSHAGMTPPAKDERQTLIEFLRFNQNAFFAVAFGLTDEQARSKPSVSALSIGGLIKHTTSVQHSWMARVTAAPGSPPRDDRPFAEQAAEYGDQYVMRDDETLAQLLDKLHAQNEDTLRIFGEPTSTPRFPFRTTCRGFRRTWTSGMCAGWRFI
jgi:hypothetical protein